MNRVVKMLLLAGTHLAAIGLGFMLGIYTLPILTAPPGPAAAVVQAAAESATYRGTFHRELEKQRCATLG